jgi:hypothetical protein
MMAYTGGNLIRYHIDAHDGREWECGAGYESFILCGYLVLVTEMKMQGLFP